VPVIGNSILLIRQVEILSCARAQAAEQYRASCSAMDKKERDHR